MEQRKVAVLTAAGISAALALWLLRQRQLRRRKEEYGDLNGDFAAPCKSPEPLATLEVMLRNA